MITRAEVISRLRNSLNEVTGDSRFSNRYLWNVFLTASKDLIKQDADRGRIYSQANIWDTICIKMEPVSSSLCDCICFPGECTVYRSKDKLPKFVESTDGFIYRFIGTPDLSKTFTLVSPFQYSVKRDIKYNKEKYVFLHNGYVFTPSHTYPQLLISGIFEGDTNMFKCDGSEASVGHCYHALAQNISLNDYLVRTAIGMSLQELMGSKQIPKDELTNDNTNQKEISS
jgi:hypothetical protein